VTHDVQTIVLDTAHNSSGTKFESSSGSTKQYTRSKKGPRRDDQMLEKPADSDVMLKRIPSTCSIYFWRSEPIRLYQKPLGRFPLAPRMCHCSSNQFKSRKANVSSRAHWRITPHWKFLLCPRFRCAWQEHRFEKTS
jgi:hypothetical protein